MSKNQNSDYRINVKNFVFFLVFIAACLIFQFIYYFTAKPTSYSFFIEFNNVNGLKIGTPIRMRGVYIGSIKSISLKPNCVLVMAQIISSKVLVSSCSIVEITQTGLLNEPVLDVIAREYWTFKDDQILSPLSSACDSSAIICKDMYVIGDRGLNYDDLIRSATRISQRFDDPRFFNLFYLFLHNGIEVADAFMELTKSAANAFLLNHFYVDNFLLDDPL